MYFTAIQLSWNMQICRCATLTHTVCFLPRGNSSLFIGNSVYQHSPNLDIFPLIFSSTNSCYICLILILSLLLIARFHQYEFNSLNHIWRLVSLISVTLIVKKRQANYLILLTWRIELLKTQFKQKLRTCENQVRIIAGLSNLTSQSQEKKNWLFLCSVISYTLIL